MRMPRVVTKYLSEQILKMTDDELFTEMKKLKKLIYRQRKSGARVRDAEEEMCYLQAEAQNRGHKF